MRGCDMHVLYEDECADMDVGIANAKVCLCRKDLCNHGMQVSPKTGNWLQFLMLLCIVVATAAGPVDDRTSGQL